MHILRPSIKKKGRENALLYNGRPCWGSCPVAWGFGRIVCFRGQFPRFPVSSPIGVTRRPNSSSYPASCGQTNRTSRNGKYCEVSKWPGSFQFWDSSFFVIKRVETPNFKEFFWVFTLHTRNDSMFHLVLNERDLQSLVWWGTPTLTPSFAIRVLHETVSSQREVFLCISVSCLAESTCLINVEHGLGFI